MDEKSRWQLDQSVELLNTVLLEDVDPKIASVYLSVAGDYCHQVAEKIKKEN